VKRRTWGWSLDMTPEQRRAYIHGVQASKPPITPKPKRKKRPAPPAPPPACHVVQAPAFVQVVFDYLRINWTEDDLTRPVSITPYAGAYGRAGYVITVNGTPPRVVLMVIGSELWRSLDHALMCFVFPKPRTQLRWLQPYAGGSQWLVRKAVVGLLFEQGLERRAA
jgi:hypothetical protein